MKGAIIHKPCKYSCQIDDKLSANLMAEYSVIEKTCSSLKHLKADDKMYICKLKKCFVQGKSYLENQRL